MSKNPSLFNFGNEAPLNFIDSLNTKLKVKDCLCEKMILTIEKSTKILYILFN